MVVPAHTNGQQQCMLKTIRGSGGLEFLKRYAATKRIQFLDKHHVVMDKKIKRYISWVITLLVIISIFAWTMYGHGLRLAYRLSHLHIVKQGADIEILYSSSRNREAYHIVRLKSDSLIAGTPDGIPLTKVNLEFSSSDKMLATVLKRVEDHVLHNTELLRFEWYYGRGKELLADVFIAKSSNGTSIVYVSFY